MKFVSFIEHNDYEGESWRFWLQLDENEAALNKLQEAIKEQEYSLDLSKTLSETEVDVLVDNSRSGYMAFEHKVKGKFSMPENYSERDYDDKPFYKGGIKDFFK